MKKLTIGKKLYCLVLALAMVITMSVMSLSVYAAGGGEIKVLYNPDDVDLAKATNFELYKVGSFSHDSNGKSVIVLESWVEDSNVDLNIEIPETDAEKTEGSDWNKEWLAAAESLENWIKTTGASTTPEWNGSLSQSSTYQSLGTHDNGIYLLVGDEQLAGDTYWSPVPVLIMVLNEESDFAIVNSDLKMTSRPLADEHTVVKLWSGDEDYSDERPEYVKVGIYYGSSLVDTVELNDDNDWTYTWYTQKDSKNSKGSYSSKDPDDAGSIGVETANLNSSNDYTISMSVGDSSWRVDELSVAASDNEYKVSVNTKVSDDGRYEHFSVTNNFVSPPPPSNPPSPDTGDQTNVLLPVIVMLAALILLTILFFSKIKKNKED